MNTTVRKCPHCNSDVLARYAEDGTIYYEPCGSDSDSAALYKARKVTTNGIPPYSRNLDDSSSPYPGMAAAFELHFGQSWTDRDWRNEASVWAAAWKASLQLQENDMSRKIHVGIHIESALKKPDQYLEGMLIDEHGHELSPEEARQFLAEEAAKGYTIFCGCDNRREDGGCAGHEVQ